MSREWVLHVVMFLVSALAMVELLTVSHEEDISTVGLIARILQLR